MFLFWTFDDNVTRGLFPILHLMHRCQIERFEHFLKTLLRYRTGTICTLYLVHLCLDNNQQCHEKIMTRLDQQPKKFNADKEKCLTGKIFHLRKGDGDKRPLHPLGKSRGNKFLILIEQNISCFKRIQNNIMLAANRQSYIAAFIIHFKFF